MIRVAAITFARHKPNLVFIGHGEQVYSHVRAYIHRYQGTVDGYVDSIVQNLSRYFLTNRGIDATSRCDTSPR